MPSLMRPAWTRSAVGALAGSGSGEGAGGSTSLPSPARARARAALAQARAAGSGGSRHGLRLGRRRRRRRGRVRDAELLGPVDGPAGGGRRTDTDRRVARVLDVRAMPGRGEPRGDNRLRARVAVRDVLAPRTARVAARGQPLSDGAVDRGRRVRVGHVAVHGHVARLPGRGRAERAERRERPQPEVRAVGVDERDDLRRVRAARRPASRRRERSRRSPAQPGGAASAAMTVAMASRRLTGFFPENRQWSVESPSPTGVPPASLIRGIPGRVSTSCPRMCVWR